jgi:hypothetical protein
MVRTLGPARFARFWSSEQPLERAFVSATGESLDAWMRDWAIRSYGHASSGPTVASVGLLAGAIAVIVAFGLALGIGLRRRVV